MSIPAEDTPSPDTTDLPECRELDVPVANGSLSFRERLGPFTWFRVGGPADVLFLPADENDLAYFLSSLPAEIPVTVLGVGSNVIIRDGGVAGVVIRLAGRAFSGIEAEGVHIRAGAGALDSRIAQAAAAAGIGGLEFLTGVPGALGGALAMNAGCYGREIRDVCQSVTAIGRDGRRHVLDAASMGFSYRRNAAPAGLIFTGAVLAGHADDPAAIAARMAEISARRQNSQPIREKTGGSTFKNPDPALSGGRSAWQCVDAAGMRGARLGDAEVSTQHANFLINRGAASARDIEALGEKVIATVREKLGVTLEWEIKRIGRHRPEW